jgi:hypothetical protein
MGDSFLSKLDILKDRLKENLAGKGVTVQLANISVDKLRRFLVEQSTESPLSKLVNLLNDMKHEERLSKSILVYILFFIALNLVSLIDYQYPDIMPFEDILVMFEKDEVKQKKIRDSLSLIQKTNIVRAYNMLVNIDFQTIQKVTRFGDWARVFLTFCGNEICVSQTGSGMTPYFSFWCNIIRVHFKIPIYPRLSRRSSLDKFRILVENEEFMKNLETVGATHGDMSINRFLREFGTSKVVDSAGGGGGGGSSSIEKRSREEIGDALNLLKFSKTSSSSEEDDEEGYVVIFSSPEESDNP